MMRKDTESRGRTTNSMRSSPTILGCSLQNALESRTSSPGIVQLLWHELVERTDPWSSNTKTFQQSWRNLGLPWIPGYIPKPNYQNAIFDAIDRYLSQHSNILESPQISQPEVSESSEVFVDPPPPTTGDQKLPERLQRLVRKFDPVERDKRNRSLGKAGEAFVLDVERHRLAEADRIDLSRKIRWISQEDGDGAGYDILSYDYSGSERLIEVKTTNGAARTPFFLSRNECDLANERPRAWCIYRVHLFARQPRIFTISPPIEDTVHLRPETWRASF